MKTINPKYLLKILNRSHKTGKELSYAYWNHFISQSKEDQLWIVNNTAKYKHRARRNLKIQSMLSFTPNNYIFVFQLPRASRLEIVSRTNSLGVAIRDLREKILNLYCTFSPSEINSLRTTGKLN